MDFDATNIYPSAMWDDEGVYLNLENGYVFTVDMNIDLVEKFISGNFNQGSATLKNKYYNRPDVIYQHLPVKERVQKTEVNRNRNGYNKDTLISVDIKKIIRIGAKIFQNFEGALYEEDFRVNIFKRTIG